MRIFIASENSDLTEGRGPMKVIGLFEDFTKALDFVKGRGVMGVGDGEVHYIDYSGEDHYPNFLDPQRLLYGYRQNPHTNDWRFGYGFTLSAERLGLIPSDRLEEHLNI